MSSITVLLADDHELVRAGIRALLQDMPGIEVVAEASNGREAIQLTEKHRPHVVLMDILMPEMNGLDATARITASYPHIGVLMLSMNANEEYVLPALRAGASGYLIKNCTPAELKKAIRAVAAGEKYLVSAVAKHVIAGVLQEGTGQSEPLDRLTTRQREVLQLVAEGFSTKEIARKLNISAKTVEGHRFQLMNSLEIHDIAGLVRYAIRVGLISSYA